MTATPDAPSYVTIGPSGTGYANHTLDELRLLAASIDTGRIESMQTSFTNIATHLDLVAAALTHLRTTIPDYWQGPTAEATAQKLTQVITRTHQAQDTAQGASTALRLCTQVVATQQSAMKSVPEIPDPTTTPPPSTLLAGDPVMPRSAAMAAQRQAYAAAQEEAVRHVNGIAAQYVETTAQLQGLTDMHSFGEDFQPVTPGAEGIASNTKDVRHTISITHTEPTLRTSLEAETAYTGEPIVHYQTPLAEGITEMDSKPSKPTLDLEHRTSIVPTTASQFLDDSSRYNIPREMNSPPRLPPATEPVSMGDISLASERGLQLPPEAALNPVDVNYKVQPGGSSAHSEPYLWFDKTGRARFGDPVPDRPRSKITNQYEVSRYSDDPLPPGSRFIREPDSQLKPAQSHRVSEPAESRENYGPLGMSGPRVSQEREERGRRPDYLREAKSTWLSRVPAAPYNGVLTPDWDDR